MSVSGYGIVFAVLVGMVGAVLGEAPGWRVDPTTGDDVLAAEDWARSRARELLCAPTHPDRSEPEVRIPK